MGALMFLRLPLCFALCSQSIPLNPSSDRGEAVRGFWQGSLAT
jgi:hypothetical protein